MVLYYEGVDITDHVTTISARSNDRFMHKFDDLAIEFLDEFKQWSSWNPKIDDSIRIKTENADSGTMYVDVVAHSCGKIKIKAIPVKSKAKTAYRRTFEKVTFDVLASKLASECGLSYKLYGVPSITYEWLDQPNKNNIEFLSYLCKLEALSMKVFNGCLTIVSLEYAESLLNKTEINKDDYPDFEVKKTGPIIGGYDLLYNGIKASYKESDNAVLRREDIPFQDETTGKRFAKNMTNLENKMNSVFEVRCSAEAYAGSCITTKGYGVNLEKVFVYEVSNDMIKDIRVIKGYCL